MTFDKLIKRINKKIDKCISNGDKSLYLEIKVSYLKIYFSFFLWYNIPKDNANIFIRRI